jgi:hypothetical protein
LFKHHLQQHGIGWNVINCQNLEVRIIVRHLAIINLICDLLSLLVLELLIGNIVKKNGPSSI